MLATLIRKACAERELTAQPKSIEAEIWQRGRRDDGTSVDSDDLADQFIAGAIEQPHYEGAMDATPELFVTSAPPHDGPIIGPNFDVDRDLWEQTVALTLQARPEAWSAAAIGGGRPASSVDEMDEMDEMDEVDEDDLEPSDETESLFDLDADLGDHSLLGAFDDDERWKEVARTGRAL